MLRRLVVASLAGVLAACGGQSGGSATTPTPTASPYVATESGFSAVFPATPRGRRDPGPGRRGARTDRLLRREAVHFRRNHEDHGCEASGLRHAAGDLQDALTRFSQVQS